MAELNDKKGWQDQAAALRELAHRNEKAEATTIAVVSGKGGVGKSNIAVNLSLYLARAGQEVLLADLDFGLANTDLLLNVNPTYTLSHVFAGVRTVSDVIVEVPGGLQLLPGATGGEGLADLTEFARHHLLNELRIASRSIDIAILDCGAGISTNVLDFAWSATDVLVVTTPQPTALADAYGTIKALVRHMPSLSIHLFVNMVKSRDDARAAYQRVARVAQRFLNYSVADAGYMMHDTAVEHAVRTRQPFVTLRSDTSSTASIASLANRLARQRVVARESVGLLGRVANLFM